MKTKTLPAYTVDYLAAEALRLNALPYDHPERADLVPMVLGTLSRYHEGCALACAEAEARLSARPSLVSERPNA